MGKTNFTKTERALEKGLQKMAVDRLLDLADKKQAAEENQEPSSSFSEIAHELDHSFKLLERDLKKMQKKDPDIYKTLDISGEELERALKHPHLLKPEEIEKIKEIIDKVEEYKKLTQSEEQKQHQIEVEEARRMQKRRAHNVKNNWIPL
jgi:hypothetical protein